MTIVQNNRTIVFYVNLVLAQLQTRYKTKHSSAGIIFPNYCCVLFVVFFIELLNLIYLISPSSYLYL
jgi:hypothetical protein